MKKIDLNTDIPYFQVHLDKCHLKGFLMKTWHSWHCRSHLICYPYDHLLDNGRRYEGACPWMTSCHCTNMQSQNNINRLHSMMCAHRSYNIIHMKRKKVKDRFAYLDLDFVPRNWTFSCTIETKNNQHK
jgi:hypothetical protein